MSLPDEPDRKIGGLQPRPTFNAKSLIKSQRTETEKPPASGMGERTNGASKRRSQAPASSGKTSLTVYVPDELRTRARALYRATSHLEDDRTFSHMVEKMLEAAIRERELRYNEGMPFAGDKARLSSGRPRGGD
jgi:hypothetical protein